MNNENVLSILSILFFLCSCASTDLRPGTPNHSSGYDVVILNGRVIDPETNLDAIRNVGLRGDKIAVVTRKDINGRQIIDAAGKIVAPGFIDFHAHGQTILSGRVQALDGVTTALELEAGMLPIAEYYDNAASEGRPINYGASVNWAHARIAEKTGDEPTSDIDFFFSHLGDLSWQQDLAADDEVSAILARVQEGLDEGGLGIGVLLGYAPGAGRKEYYELNKLAAVNGVPTFTHARFLSAIEPDSSFEGYQEMIAVAATTGAHMHICHLNSISLRDIHDIEPLISNAAKNGIRLTVEAYPYGAGATGIGAAMFKGPNWQERLGGIEKSDFSVAGEPLTADEFDRLQKDAPETGVVLHMLNPDNRPEDRDALDKSILFPGGIIASDGGEWTDSSGRLLPQDVWPLPPDAESHPRSAGTFSRFLRVFVRERGAISLKEGIEKVSYLPAKILQESVPQMHHKGRIQKGADADIVVFDLGQISDRATYEEPAQTSVGFSDVLVGGERIVVDGQINTKILPGRPIRRPFGNKKNLVQ